MRPQIAFHTQGLAYSCPQQEQASLGAGNPCNVNSMCWSVRIFLALLADVVSELVPEQLQSTA
jgi:hypothetical protein